MHSVPLRSLNDPSSPIPVFEYRDVLKTVVSRPTDPQKGADITEMRQSIRVLDALDRANGTLELEDADYDVLKHKLETFAWNLVDRRIVQLMDDVSGA